MCRLATVCAHLVFLCHNVPLDVVLQGALLRALYCSAFYTYTRTYLLYLYVFTKKNIGKLEENLNPVAYKRLLFYTGVHLKINKNYILGI